MRDTDLRAVGITDSGATSTHELMAGVLAGRSGTTLTTSQIRRFLEETGSGSWTMSLPSDHHVHASPPGRCYYCTDAGHPLLQWLRRGVYLVL